MRLRITLAFSVLLVLFASSFNVAGQSEPEPESLWETCSGAVDVDCVHFHDTSCGPGDVGTKCFVCTLYTRAISPPNHPVLLNPCLH